VNIQKAAYCKLSTI